jgi:hypothetical protein
MSRMLRLTVEDRNTWLEVCAEILCIGAELDLTTKLGRTMMDIGMGVIEETAQKFLDHPRIQFDVGDDTP